MRKNIFPLFFFLSLFLVLTSFSNASGRSAGLPPLFQNALVHTLVPTDASETAAGLTAQLHQALKLDEAGLEEKVLEHALKGYFKLVVTGRVQNRRYLSIVDMSQSSRKKRFYLIDLQNQKLAMNTFVSHGKNSGIDKATRFSNVPESEQTSLGFYVTKSTYTGKHGLSLKLEGLEKGFNDNAEARAIVVHGAEYVNSQRVASDFMGRSQGCPALPQEESARIINLIKDGSTMFVYHPTKSYIKASRFLNS